ncbi:MAG TPA: ribonuclease D [Gammaproteobacteria bacterium]|nr:ribonuclease D [Gammaproteobacteria bacterium]
MATPPETIHYIDTPGALIDLCERLHGCERLALDTEFIRERTYYPQLCLVQLATAGEIAIVDPLALSDLRPLLDLLCDTSVLKILHAARQDLEIFHLLTGEVPAPVFDTQIAASLCGFGDQIGYAALVDRLLGITLDKGQTRTDWTRRPLTPEMLRYAADDVRHLGTLYQRLHAELERNGRLEWLTSELALLTRADTYRNDPGEAWRRVRGAQRLKPRERAVLAALAAWRERTAAEANKPRGWILRDDLLIELARRQPETMAELAELRDLGEGFLARRGSELLHVIRTARAGEMPADEARLPPLGPEREALVDILMAIVRQRAAEHGVSAANLATRRDLEKLVRGERDGSLFADWKHEAIGRELLDVLEGRKVLRVQEGKLRIE